ncbi:MAG: hypothetical protein RBS16_06500 [Candidatus Cloacimonadales bacterium]|nr:hypothetical protein [Candidatus Cloacimonadota bacterium]MDD3502236.1 hypothetical protein [Candidatus Cloacimonadota bacterium]MDX9977668.1 hypothetical protein [Candidatus Cloacimonadales bacterium]
MDELLKVIQEANHKENLAKVEREFLAYCDEISINPVSFTNAVIPNKLLDIYDKEFFNKHLKKNIKTHIRVSRQMTRVAGKVRHNRINNVFEIAFSAPLIVHSFYQFDDSSYYINGILCRSSEEALMRVMEHELVHIIEILLTGNTSCAKKHFKNLAHQLFGHTKTKHEIIPNAIKQVSQVFKNGDRVIFHYRDTSYIGFINRITKRATVLVESKEGTFINRQGIRYNKYYVPLQALKKVD